MRTPAFYFLHRYILEIESTINDSYLIKSEIGHGGMGIVYLTHDTLLERSVAIKFLSRAEFSTEGRSILLHEAHALEQLNHQAGHLLYTPRFVSVMSISFPRMDEYALSGSLHSYCNIPIPQLPL
jgi:serine/threonine protein kinase